MSNFHQDDMESIGSAVKEISSSIPDTIKNPIPQQVLEDMKSIGSVVEEIGSSIPDHIKK